MRRSGRRLLSTLLLLSGCDDSLGLAGGCRAEMRRVQDNEGPPESVESSEFRGNHVEQWLYFGGSRGNRSYTFEWGDSFGSCRVSGPTRFSRGTLSDVPDFPER